MIILGVALILGIVGIILLFSGGIWMLVLAFQDDVVWGLLYLFVPFAALVFLIKKWSKKPVRKSFFLQLIGFALAFVAAIIAGLQGSNPLLDSETVTPPESEWSTETNEDFTPTAPSPTPTATPETSQPVSPATPSPTPAATPETSQPVSPATPEPNSAPSQFDYTQSMNVGYAAFDQGDYQTALINFQRALKERPGDVYATKAIQSTEAVIKGN